MEGALKEWFFDAKEKEIPLSWAIIAEKAKELAKHLNRDDFTVTTGWLNRWRDRNNIPFGQKRCKKKKTDDSEVSDGYVSHCGIKVSFC